MIAVGAIFLLVVIGLPMLAALIALLAFRKTRGFTIGVLCVLALLLMSWRWTAVSNMQDARSKAQARQHEARATHYFVMAEQLENGPQEGTEQRVAELRRQGNDALAQAKVYAMSATDARSRLKAADRYFRQGKEFFDDSTDWISTSEKADELRELGEESFDRYMKSISVLPDQYRAEGLQKVADVYQQLSLEYQDDADSWIATSDKAKELRALGDWAYDHYEQVQSQIPAVARNQPTYAAGARLPVVLISIVTLVALVVLVRHGHKFPAVLLLLVAVGAVLFSASFVTYRQAEVPVEPLMVGVADSQTVDQAWEKLTEPKIQVSPSDTAAEDGSKIEDISDVKAEVSTSAEFTSIAASSGEMRATPPATPVQGKPADAKPADATPASKSFLNMGERRVQRVGNVYRQQLEAGPYATEDDARRAVQPKIRQAVTEYIRDIATNHSQGGAYIPPLEELGVTPRYIRDNILVADEEFFTSRDTSIASDMKTIHVMLEYDARVDDQLTEMWRSYARRERVATVGVATGGVVAALAGILGLIKLDTATKGYYTKRLFIGVPLAIMGVLALAMMMVA